MLEIRQSSTVATCNMASQTDVLKATKEQEKTSASGNGCEKADFYWVRGSNWRVLMSRQIKKSLTELVDS